MVLTLEYMPEIPEVAEIKQEDIAHQYLKVVSVKKLLVAVMEV